MQASSTSVQTTAGDSTKSNEKDSVDKVIVLRETEPLTWQFWRKRRYIVVLMAFFGFFNVYSLRVNLSVGIVAMTELRPVEHANGTIGYEQYFDWDSREQGLILSTFFYGYLLTQFIGGYFGSRLGGNWVFSAGIGVTAILTLLTPLAAKSGVTALIVVRILEGIAEGVTFPCIHAVWSRWAPPNERSRMAGIAFSGSYVGTVVTMPLSGILASTLGWESVFYVFGAVGCVWYLAWIWIVREGPELDKSIGADELRYIQESLQQKGKERLVYPWAAIFTSPAVYAICVAHFAANWGFFTLLTHLPTFLKDTLHYDLNGAGFLSAAPYLTLAIGLPLVGFFADHCQVKGWLTTSQVRRHLNCGGFLAQTVFMLIAAYLVHPIGSIIAITIAVGLGAFGMCGYAVNHLDIAPQYASVLMGITNTVGTIPGIVSPTLTGYLVQNKTAEEWRIVFYISSGIYLVGCIVFWFWSTGEVQPWAKVVATPLVDVNTVEKHNIVNQTDHKGDIKGEIKEDL